MNAYLQKHKLKILLAVFCLAVVLPLVSLTKTVLADCVSDCDRFQDQSDKDVCVSTCNQSKSVSQGETGLVDTKSENDPAGTPGLIEQAIIFLLKIVLKFVTILLNIAETLFQWIVNPNTMKAIMTNSAVYTTWRAVRDVLNVVFIMVLLFSAFATVFQYSKYNYKSVLRNLVLMALLVNFSYPIARFIIDLSNIIMFGFLQSMGGDNSFMSIIKGSGLDWIVGGTSPNALFLLSAIVFTFILAITLLVIAVLLIIRTVSLTLYIIFSPLAFVGSVLPGTKLDSAGNEWWTDFMKNCFAGPIIVFMLYVANVLMSAMASSGGKIKTIANMQVNGLEDPGNISQLITGVSIFVLPIIVLWYGIILAQSSGIKGAEAVVKTGKKAGKWLAKNPALGSVGFISKKSGLSGAAKQKWEQTKKNSWLGSEKTAQREAKMAARFNVKGAEEKDMRRRAAEHKKNDTTDNELKSLAAAGDAGAAFRLAEDKKMDQATYDGFTRTNTNASLRGAINAKVKQNRNDLVAINKSNDAGEQAKQSNIDGGTAASTPAAQLALYDNATRAGLTPAIATAISSTRVTTEQYIANQQMGSLTAEQWNDQNWTDILQPVGPQRPGESLAAYTIRANNRNAERDSVIRATRTAWASMKAEARAEIHKRLSANNASALEVNTGIV
ncbi:MAG: hypothetical protein WA064_04920 [Candidatus Moraniibacteriota bacterium]